MSEPEPNKSHNTNTGDSDGRKVRKYIQYKSIRSECLGHLILFSVKHLEYVIEQYCAYYRHERIHQGVGQIIKPKHAIDERADIVCIERLGGLLKSYHRLAA